MEYNMIFVMGYDLLHDELNKWDLPCDVAFNVCKEIYNDFLNSEEYKLNMSEYEALYLYIWCNKQDIDSRIELAGKFYN